MHPQDKGCAVFMALGVLAIVLVLFAAAWLGRARAAASVECVKAGGDWVDNECTRKP